jgi:hypothetical protein
MDITDSDLLPLPGPRFSGQPIDTARSIAHDFSNRHVSASTFTPAAQLHIYELPGLERPRPYSIPMSQSHLPGGPHPHGLEGVSEALHETMRDAAKAQKPERGRSEAGYPQLQHYEGAEPSFGGHQQFPGAAENEPVGEPEESPEQRYGSRWMD